MSDSIQALGRGVTTAALGLGTCVVTFAVVYLALGHSVPVLLGLGGVLLFGLAYLVPVRVLVRASLLGFVVVPFHYLGLHQPLDAFPPPTLLLMAAVLAVLLRPTIESSPGENADPRPVRVGVRRLHSSDRLHLRILQRSSRSDLDDSVGVHAGGGAGRGRADERSAVPGDDLARRQCRAGRCGRRRVRHQVEPADLPLRPLGGRPHRVVGVSTACSRRSVTRSSTAPSSRSP